jgi:5-methylcytosine-specific restriction protein A
MPVNNAKHYCNHPGCRTLTTDIFCDHHKPLHKPKSDQFRGNSAERGYDEKWKRFRKFYLAENPMCFDCAKNGIDRFAREVHHIVKLSAGGERLDPKNCMALCRSCHQIRTMKGE